MRKRQTLRLMLQLTLVLRETLRLRLRSTVALTLRLRLHSPYIEPSPTLTDITAINPRYVSNLSFQYHCFSRPAHRQQWGQKQSVQWQSVPSKLNLNKSHRMASLSVLLCTPIPVHTADTATEQGRSLTSTDMNRQMMLHVVHRSITNQIVWPLQTNVTEHAEGVATCQKNISIGAKFCLSCNL